MQCAYLLVDCPTLIVERLLLLKCINLCDINLLSVYILNSNNIVVIRTIINCIFRTGLRISTLSHAIDKRNVCHYLFMVYMYNIYVLLELYILLLLFRVCLLSYVILFLCTAQYLVSLR